MQPDEVSSKAAQARLAQSAWRAVPIKERVRLVRRLWQRLDARKEEIFRIVNEETGKPPAEIEMMEWDSLQLILRYWLDSASHILKDRNAPRPWFLWNKKTYVHYEPRGVIGVITPWNMPLLIPLGDSLAAILAGNAVLLKPSEWTSRSALWLEDAIESSAILPKGLFSAAIGDGAVGAQVAQEADQILFTGSVNGGRLVAEAAAKALKPAILELGGKHPMIVLEDAPLERAAEAAVWGAFANCGQLCVGVERAYVETKIYDRFVEAVQKEMGKIRQGIDEPDVDIGRLIFPPQLQVVQSHLADAKAKGARVIGGEMIDEACLVMRPALILDATSGMKAMSEETFGPVLPIMRVQNAEQAVRLANKSHLGLSASVWTKDIRRGRLIGSSLQAGLIGINDVMSHYAMASLPFGGVKQSGLGFRHSEEGLRQFCVTQSVVLHRWPLKIGELWWFPYTPLKTRLVSFLTRL